MQTLIELIDGRTPGTLQGSDWILLTIAGLVVVIALAMGFFAWLKGHRVVAILAWLLMVAALVSVLAPTSSVDDLAAGWGLDSEEVAWVVAGSVAASLVLGVLAAVRLARPASWWAQRRYTSEKYALAVERHGFARVKAR